MSLIRRNNVEEQVVQEIPSEILDKLIAHLEELDEAQSQRAYDLVKYFTAKAPKKKQVLLFDMEGDEPEEDLSKYLPVCSMDEFKNEIRKPEHKHYKTKLKNLLRSNVLREFRESRLHIGLLSEMVSLNENIIDGI